MGPPRMEEWYIPGIEFPDGEDPMADNTIRSLLLQPQFCRNKGDASRRDRLTSNLRAIFGSLTFLYDYISLGDIFWAAFARRLSLYWDGNTLELIVRLYARARKRYLGKHPYDEIHDPASVILIAEIDAYLHRASVAVPTQPAGDLRRAFDRKLENWNSLRYMWPYKRTSMSRDVHLSIKGLAARNEVQAPKQYADQYRPDGPSPSPIRSARGVPERTEDWDNKSPSLASRISYPPKSGTISVAPSDNGTYSPSSSTRESPRNTLKRGGSFSTDLGPSKRRVGDPDSSTSPFINQQLQAEMSPRGPEAASPPRHSLGHIKMANTAILNYKPESPKAQENHKPFERAETVEKPNTVKQLERVTQSNTMKQPDTVEPRRVDTVKQQVTVNQQGMVKQQDTMKRLEPAKQQGMMKQQDTVKHSDTVKQQEAVKHQESLKQQEAQENQEALKHSDTMKHPEQAKQSEAELMRIEKVEAQLKAIGEILDKRFSGIEAQVVAVQEKISENAVLHVDRTQTGPPPEKLPSTHYVEEYLRDRNHQVLLKGVSDEIHRIKGYLLHGLRDHEKNQTSAVWRVMEGVWSALDEAEERAGTY